MIDKLQKEQLIKDFTFMRGFEVSAKDFYLKVANDESVENEEIKATFKNIAKDEDKHVKIMDKIIHLIETAL